VNILRTRLTLHGDVPILAMVDAFIGGIAIILIMIIISEPSDRTPDTIPRADVVVACFNRESYVALDGTNLGMAIGPPIPRLDLVRELGGLADQELLVLRVLFVGTATRSGCLLRAQDLLEIANQLSEPGPDGMPLPVFLTDLRLVAEQDMPPLPEIAQ